MTEDIRDIKPLYKIDMQYTWWPWLVLAGALIAGLLFYLWYRKRKKKPKPANAIPSKTPGEIALIALEALQTQSIIHHQEAIRLLYFQISNILKIYIEARFLFNATDLTTEEILQHDNMALFKNLLTELDNIKYSTNNTLPTDADIARIFKQAKDVIL